MKLSVLSSGSSANGYVLQTKEEAVVIECGCPFLECQKALDFNISKVQACLLSHEHGDHARHAVEYSRYLPIYATKGTLEAAGIRYNGKKMKILTTYRVGGFRLLTFPVIHDARQASGFLINHKECGTILFATDTHRLRHTFPNISHYMLECNFSDSILSQNVKKRFVPLSVAERVSKCHMSLRRCIETLQSNDLSKTKEIILLHLSSQNANAETFCSEVRMATGKDVRIAKKGLEIELW